MSIERIDSIKYCCSLKAAFVEHLAGLVKMIEPNVQSLKYEYQADENTVLEETVVIAFKSGFVRKVDVTRSSCKSIIEDVLKKI